MDRINQKLNDIGLYLSQKSVYRIFGRFLDFIERKFGIIATGIVASLFVTVAVLFACIAITMVCNRCDIVTAWTVMREGFSSEEAIQGIVGCYLF